MGTISKQIITLLLFIFAACESDRIVLDPQTKCVLRTGGIIMDMQVLAVKEDSVILANVFVGTMKADKFCFEDWKSSFKCLDSIHHQNLLIPECEYTVNIGLGFDRGYIDIHFYCDSLLNIVPVNK